MTNSPQSDRHLDADQLAAFAEDALTATERARCVAHLSECAHCREVAFLADAAAAEAVPQPKPVRQPSWRSGWWWPAFSLGGVAAVVVLIAVLHQRAGMVPRVPPLAQVGAPLNPLAANSPAVEGPTPPGGVGLASRTPRRSSAPAAAKPAQPQPAAPSRSSVLPTDKAVVPQAPTLAMPHHGRNSDTQAFMQAQTAEAAPRSTFLGGMAAAQRSPTPEALGDGAAAQATQDQAAQDYVLRTGRVVNGLVTGAQVAGVITDATGAVVPRARVAVEDPRGTLHRVGTSDTSGRFAVGPLPPGIYRVEITAPGFVAQTREVQLGRDQHAQLDTALAVGAASESVTVDAASASVVSTQNATVNSALLEAVPQPAAPSLQTTVSIGEQRLAIDGAGHLLRNDHGRWKFVHGPWKRARITSLSVLAASQYRVVTAMGSWTSADGRHWQKMP